MNLVMCQSMWGNTSDEVFWDKLRYPIIAATFFKEAFPEGKVFLATCPEAKVPEYCRRFFHVIRVNFKSNPFAISRQTFYKLFCEQLEEPGDIIFAGSDVIFTGKPFPDLPPHKLLMSYRYHPAQPYCSDLVIVRGEHRDYGVEFFDDVVRTMCFMPESARKGWGDQLASVLSLGRLPKEQFDGNNHYAPARKDALLVPGDDWLYTPNDGFSSTVLYFDKRCDVKTNDELMALLDSKITIHAKGTRKVLQIAMGYMAWLDGKIDPYKFGLEVPPGEFFKEVISVQEEMAA